MWPSDDLLDKFGGQASCASVDFGTKGMCATQIFPRSVFEASENLKVITNLI